MNQVRGGLHEDEIVGIYADEDEATAGGDAALGRNTPSVPRMRCSSRSSSTSW